MMSMKILYSCVGTTDPVRAETDGPILQIIRHYQPDRAELFISDELMELEEKKGWYSRAIKHVKADCEVNLIDTEIVNAHEIDSLGRLQLEFTRIITEYPDAQILLNLTSGTPQMNAIMMYLAVEYPQTLGIQVITPKGTSNKREKPYSGDENLDVLLANNLDDLPGAPNRCREPHMYLVRLKEVAKEINLLCKEYNYGRALEVYERNKTFLNQDIGLLLQHAFDRSNLQYVPALRTINHFGTITLRNGYDSSLSPLWEYLMTLELRYKQGLVQEFFVKLTPFLYELLKWYLFTYKKVDKNKIGVERKKKIIIVKEKVEKNYPTLKAALDKKYPGGLRNNSDLNFLFMYHFLCFTSCSISESQEESQLVKDKLYFLRTVENSIRNKLAHNIVPLTEQDVENATEGKTTEFILNEVKSVFFMLIGNHKKKDVLIYDVINEIISELLKQ